MSREIVAAHKAKLIGEVKKIKELKRVGSAFYNLSIESAGITKEE